uniref:Uncharacterized protein n=1 Tax=Oryza brachyantha TaxID=4533 RepID=J3M0H3_ORYBR
MELLDNTKFFLLASLGETKLIIIRTISQLTLKVLSITFRIYYRRNNIGCVK